ncbi:hypothetical protein [Glaciimonas immobilis]|uniref:Uncharacterized protein n=1 Tax=Glaciimonas immobilis TaxID=728004 RepID=A0A840RVU1_9BURK|nr:hypothetical protein [Glaciimonas immobilis]KAF3997532.1 hypothetical protein HAV38_12700 [Glaciimonas immobilis]MBB5200784.1 hypothetical protein [Glaciimonas immobilis]
MTNAKFAIISTDIQSMEDACYSEACYYEYDDAGWFFCNTIDKAALFASEEAAQLRINKVVKFGGSAQGMRIVSA